jgi:hypothetical protein
VGKLIPRAVLSFSSFKIVVREEDIFIFLIHGLLRMGDGRVRLV